MKYKASAILLDFVYYIFLSIFELIFSQLILLSLILSTKSFLKVKVNTDAIYTSFDAVDLAFQDEILPR